MFHRQIVLLNLLEGFGGNLPSTDFQKYLFLYTRLCEKIHSYEFVPYKFGCFSFQSYADKSKLIDQGFLEESNDWKLSNKTGNSLKRLKKDEIEKIQLFVSKYKSLKGKELIKHVYKAYPYYATNSLIASDLLSKEDLIAVKKHSSQRKGNLFATIGYEGITIEQYMNKLIKSDVKLLVDVRKNPLSRKYGFSKSKLSEILSKLGICYQHMPELGIVSDKRKKLETKSDYDNLFSSYEKTVLIDQSSSLNSLLDLYLKNKRIAITCFEECHTMCHRSRVANAISGIADKKFEVTHL